MKPSPNTSGTDKNQSKEDFNKALASLQRCPTSYSKLAIRKKRGKDNKKEEKTNKIRKGKKEIERDVPTPIEGM